MHRCHADKSTNANTSHQVLYDSKWVQNVWDYTMPELVDASISDIW